MTGDIVVYLCGWVKAEGLGKDNVWKVKLSKGMNTRQLYVNGVRGERTRPVEVQSWNVHKDSDMEFYNHLETFEGWTHAICPVDEIVPDGDGAIVRMPCFRDCQIKGGLQIGSPSYIENVFESLENPGGWYLDRSEDTLYYISRDIQHGAKGVTVRGCRFTDITASGIQIGDFNHTDAHPSDGREIVEDIRIENNYFRDIGVDYKGSTAVIAGFVRKTEILHNEICEVAYSGISLG